MVKLRYTFTGTMEIDPDDFVCSEGMTIQQTELDNFDRLPEMYIDALEDIEITVEEVEEDG